MHGLRLRGRLWIVGLGLLLTGCVATPPPPPTPAQPATPQSAATVEPRAPATSVPAPAPADHATMFQRFMRPFLAEAQRRRAERASADPTAATRLDPTLNQDRLTFLLYGYGETHEPPLTERAFIGSFTLISYDLRHDTFDLVSLTHDIRAPEVERAPGIPDSNPKKIMEAYQFGSFDLMRKVLEDATGLAVDFQVAFPDAALVDLTDRVFDGVTVDVPVPFVVHGYYLDAVKFPGRAFAAGPTKLDGHGVLQYIKTVPVEDTYDPRLEHNQRKHQVVRALVDRFHEREWDPRFWIAALQFARDSGGNRITYDFDVQSLLSRNVGDLAASAASAIRGGDSAESAVPSVHSATYVVDPASGDGSVQWVKANAVTNPATQADLASGRYVDQAMEVPYHGDASAPDLVTGYWADVRQLVHARLTAQS